MKITLKLEEKEFPLELPSGLNSGELKDKIKDWGIALRPYLSLLDIVDLCETIHHAYLMKGILQSIQRSMNTKKGKVDFSLN